MDQSASNDQFCSLDFAKDVFEGRSYCLTKCMQFLALVSYNQEFRVGLIGPSDHVRIILRAPQNWNSGAQATLMVRLASQSPDTACVPQTITCLLFTKLIVI